MWMKRYLLCPRNLPSHLGAWIEMVLASIKFRERSNSTSERISCSGKLKRWLTITTLSRSLEGMLRLLKTHQHSVWVQEISSSRPIWTHSEPEATQLRATQCIKINRATIVRLRREGQDRRLDIRDKEAGVTKVLHWEGSTVQINLPLCLKHLTMKIATLSHADIQTPAVSRIVRPEDTQVSL